MHFCQGPDAGQEGISSIHHDRSRGIDFDSFFPFFFIISLHFYCLSLTLHCPYVYIFFDV